MKEYLEQTNMQLGKITVEVVPCNICTRKKELLYEGKHYFCHHKQCIMNINGFCDEGIIKVMEYYE